MGNVTVVGSQWGDEGKGKIVDLLCMNAQLVARFQGGANAGHTVYHGDKKIVLHQIPSGVLTDQCKCILGNGMVIDPVDLVDELQMLKDNGIEKNEFIFIAKNSHIVTPVHKWIDAKHEEATDQKIGTTCRGIGPAYVDKYDRRGVRALDLLDISLLEKIVNLGDLGDIVNVKDGYGRNFLIPQGKAKRANEANKAEFESKRAEIEKQQDALLKAAQKRAKGLDGFVLEITQKSGIDGKLFGSVTNIDITEALTNAGHEIVKSEIRMPDGPIKLIGEHMITLILHQEVKVEIKLTVTGEE